MYLSQIKEEMNTIEPGDFSFLDVLEREMLTDAYRAVTVTESWEAMKQEPGSGGFMFSGDAYMKPINAAMKYDDHSGFTYGWTMRNIQYIAQNGWGAYLEKYSELVTKYLDRLARIRAASTVGVSA